MNEFFCTPMVTFTPMDDKIICSVHIGMTQNLLEIPSLPEDDNIADLVVNLDKCTVETSKYILDGESWVKK